MQSPFLGIEMEVTRMFDLFLATKHGDIWVKIETDIGESVTIPAHSAVLRQASPIFGNMLDDRFFTENPTRTAKLQVCGDVEDAISFLRYLYTHRVGVEDIKSLVALMRFAHLYQVTGLMEACEKEALRLLTPFSVCRTCNLVENITSDSFKNYCLDLMLKSAFVIFMNDLHCSLSEVTFKQLLKSDHLNVLDEKQVLGALWKWATTNCLLQEQSTDADVEEVMVKFVSFVRWRLVRNVAIEEPWNEFYERFRDDQSASAEPRLACEKVSLSRFAESLHVFEIHGTYDRDVSLLEEIAIPACTFSVSREIVLIGLSIYYRFEDSDFTQLPFKISLNNSDFTHSVSCKHFIVSGDSSYTHRLILEFLKPVPMFAGQINTVILTAENPAYFAPSYVARPQTSGEPSSCNGEVSISTRDRITAVSNISYFVKK